MKGKTLGLVWTILLMSYPAHAQKGDNLSLFKGADVCSFDSVSIGFDGKEDQELTKIAAEQVKDFSMTSGAIFNGMNSSCFLHPVVGGDFIKIGDGSYVYEINLGLVIRNPQIQRSSTGAGTLKDVNINPGKASIYALGYLGYVPMDGSLKDTTTRMVKRLLGDIVENWRKTH